MKKNLLKGVMAMAFAMFAMGTFAQGETKVLTASGDTWTNNIDVTASVKSLAGEAFSFFIAKVI